MPCEEEDTCMPYEKRVCFTAINVLSVKKVSIYRAHVLSECERTLSLHFLFMSIYRAHVLSECGRYRWLDSF